MNLDGASDSKPEPRVRQGILGSLVDVITPMVSGNVLYGLVAVLLVTSWFTLFRGRGAAAGNAPGLMGFGTSQRVIAYEEIWRKEESELWDWLEERVGMERLRDVGKMPIEGKAMKNKLKNEKMSEREVEAAIRVTEERLSVLKDVVEKKREAAPRKEAEDTKAEEVKAEPTIATNADK